ncbi:NHL repeat-containing protein [candidate division KSB1 bacterium]
MKRSAGILLIITGFCLLLYNSLFAQKVENKDGVRIVHNEKTGKWGNNPRVSLEPQGTLGDFDAEDENYMFYLPSDIIEDEKGNRFVLDSGNIRVQKFDPRGGFLLTFGGEGQGPGEFRLPRNFGMDHSGSILVTDMANRRIEIFAQDGKLIRSKRLEEHFNEFLVVGEDRFLTSNNDFFFSSDEDNSDKHMDPLYKIRDLEGNVYSTLGITEFIEDANTTPGANSSHAAIDEEGNVYLSFQYLNRIEKYTQDGKLLLKIDRPLNYKIKIEKTEVKRFGDGGISVSSGDRNYVSRGIAVDTKGRIWNITYKRQEKEDERVGMSTSISTNEGVTQKVSGNTDLRETDMFQLELFDSEGVLLYTYQLDHFCDAIKIYGDRLYILDQKRGNQFFVYKIVEKGIN